MLTLTRKVGESIRIGDDVQIIVKEIRKNQVRIGIIAPREVKIYREEVYQNILAEDQEATEGEPDAGADADDPPPTPTRRRSPRQKLVVPSGGDDP